jgi:hypothetical protein
MGARNEEVDGNEPEVVLVLAGRAASSFSPSVNRTSPSTTSVEHDS